MKKINKLTNFLISRKKKNFEDMHGGLLAIIGIGAFLVYGYWIPVLTEIIPELVDTTNKHGLPPLAVGLWIIVGAYAATMWYYCCFATRCSTILYNRWFK